MNDRSTETVVFGLLAGIRFRLEEALSIAKAAESCADSGCPKRAVQILMDEGA